MPHEPRVGAGAGRRDACPACGSDDVESTRRIVASADGVRAVYRCLPCNQEFLVTLQPPPWTRS